MIPTKSLLALSLGLSSLAGVHLLGSRATPTTPENPGTPPHREAVWEVRVTNLTRGQIFSPPVIATHTSRMRPLWTLGEAASDELAGVAEDALNPGLIAKLSADPQVAMVTELKGKNGPILPGETAMVRVRGGYSRFGDFDRISMAGMLVITNDAFFGLNGVEAPRHGQSTLRSPAYDAGSEENNEDCAYIPGPPCNNAKVRATAGAEGYVHIHAGVHGLKSLKPEMYDWRSDVAQITIRRVQ
ncbi:MAG: spondin domain-containing protein [Planctomycetes bacterium]|nr:spondin domain-containing protein [Planctomycetota bacterium]MCB9888862.1 spondin domain-containing protein [Planctomycetota bacterium]